MTKALPLGIDTLDNPLLCETQLFLRLPVLEIAPQCKTHHIGI
jgi:hypothetical protein